jgi:hypothetical protein
MRKILFGAILGVSVVTASAILSGPAGAVNNNNTGGGYGSTGSYCTGALQVCLDGCRGLPPQQYVWCHTNCILNNQRCLGYPLVKHQGPRPIVTRPIGTKPIGNAPVESKPPVIEERENRSNGGGGGGGGRR